MKLLILLFILFSSTVFGQTELETVSLESLLTKQELKMHKCIQALDKSAKDFYAKANNCVKGSKYHQSRTPSSTQYEMIQSVIMNNYWFFGSEVMIYKFIKFIKKMNGFRQNIKKAFKTMMHGTGLGVMGSAYIVAGGNWLGEVLYHKNKIGLFCAPGFSLNTAVGAEVGIQYVRTLACKDNQHYTGGFFTATIGLNASALALPVGIAGSYSLGVDLKEWVRDIKRTHKDGSIDYIELGRELKAIAPIITADFLKSKTFGPFLYFGMKSSQLVADAFKNEVYMPELSLPANAPLSMKYLEGILTRKLSVGNVIKKSFDQMDPFFDKYNTPNLKKFLKLLNDNISGCDAIGGSASIAPQASVIANGSIAYYNYHLLLELTDKKVLEYAGLSAFTLLNPFFMNPQVLAEVSVYASQIVNLGKNVKKYCGWNNIWEN